LECNPKTYGSSSVGNFYTYSLIEANVKSVGDLYTPPGANSYPSYKTSGQKYFVNNAVINLTSLSSVTLPP